MGTPQHFASSDPFLSSAVQLLVCSVTYLSFQRQPCHGTPLLKLSAIRAGAGGRALCLPASHYPTSSSLSLVGAALPECTQLYFPISAPFPVVYQLVHSAAHFSFCRVSPYCMPCCFNCLPSNWGLGGATECLPSSPLPPGWATLHAPSHTLVVLTSLWAGK